MNKGLNLSLLVALVIMLALANGSDAQITFSRDWLAGSGKRAPSSKVTFSRDWLAGSGKRSSVAPLLDNHDILAAMTQDARDILGLLLNYLGTQFEDSPARKESFYQYLQAMERS